LNDVLFLNILATKRSFKQSYGAKTIFIAIFAVAITDFSDMKIFKSIIKYLFSKFTKIQLLIILGLVVFAFIISDSNIFARIGYDSEIRELKGQIKYYKNKSEEDRRKLEELRSNKTNIEKFARENYMMKKDNEDIFIITE